MSSMNNNYNIMITISRMGDHQTSGGYANEASENVSSSTAPTLRGMVLISLFTELIKGETNDVA